MMSRRERAKLLQAFDIFLGEHNLDPFEFLSAWGETLHEHAREATHPGVERCLDSAGEGLKQAALDLYASTK